MSGGASSSVTLGQSGAELDRARAARRLGANARASTGTGTSTVTKAKPAPLGQRDHSASISDTSDSAIISDCVSTSDRSASMSPSPSPSPWMSVSMPMPTSVRPMEEVERPLPLCLVCLARPPSAVLLPCCHLNLCYLCAPALLHRQHRQRGAAPSPSQVETIPEHSTGRVDASPSGLASTAGDPAPSRVQTVGPALVSAAIPISPSAETTEQSNAGRHEQPPPPTEEMRTDSSGETRTDSSGETRIDSSGETRTDSSGETRIDSPGETRTDSSGETRTDPRLPWSTILARATANHPAARRLSNGGYLPPVPGSRGAEMRGPDLLPRAIAVECLEVHGTHCQHSLHSTHGLHNVTSHDGQDVPDVPDRPLAADADTRLDPDHTRLGFSRKVSPDGQVTLASSVPGGGARCLVCRADVHGWLRVYTG